MFSSTRHLSKSLLNSSLQIKPTSNLSCNHPHYRSFIPTATSSLFTPSSSPRNQFSSSCIHRQSKSDSENKETQTQKPDEASGPTEAAPNGNAEKTEGSKFQEQLKDKDAKIKELQDQVLYGKADLQNLQRRSTEEKASASDFAITKLARDLTSSLDILSIALRSVPTSLRKPPSNISDLSSEDPSRVLSELYSGVELTSKSILDMLKTHGISQFDPTGEKFDPKEHEALYQAPVPGKEAGTVLECSQLGFKIKGRILRAAKVGVVQESG